MSGPKPKAPKRAKRTTPRRTGAGGTAKKPAPHRRAAAEARALTKPAAPAASTPVSRSEKAPRPAAAGLMRIEQYRSGIGCISRQKLTLRALGLRRPRQVVTRPDNEAVRGMVRAIPHLVRIVGEG